jgi:GNAT superfamily N-acetyltransferase
MAIVRHAMEKDVPRLLELYHQLALEPEKHREPPLYEALKVFRQMTQFPGCRLLVADDNGQVVGTASVAVLPALAHGTAPFAIAEYVVVDEKYRSKGIGKLLMQSAISVAKEAHCYKLTLTSDVRRERAHKFYKSLGFEASHQGFRMFL